MTNHPTRRSLLRAAPALMAPGLLASPVLASTDTPMMALFHEWEAAQAFYNGPEAQKLPEEVYNARWLPLSDEFETRAKTTPATDLRDMAAKVLILSDEGMGSLPKATILECATLVGRDHAKLPRCLQQEEA